MAGEADQTPRTIDESVVDEKKSDSDTESNILAASSSSNVAATKIVKKTTPEMVDYWKKTLVTKIDRQAYHSFSWLNCGLESTIPTVDFHTVDNTTMV
jgi:GH25 family lysozyme M1 (1,4-beta-N-acetylmuramidase)